jgi:uncharacterized protein (TIGR03067 family)
MVAVCLIGVVRADKEDAAKEEMKKLAGTWMAVEEEKDGQKPLPPKGAPTLTIKPDGKYQYQSGDQQQQGTCKCDPSQKPCQLDLIPDDSKQKPMQCIYQQKDQNQLQICISPPGKERPKQFSTQQGSGQHCITYKRK